MKILYCALAVDIGGAHGGATHVAEVANGLAALGHDLWVIGRGDGPSPAATLRARVTQCSTPPRTFVYPCGDTKIHDTAYIDGLRNDFIAAGV